jgi:hypothetical protein
MKRSASEMAASSGGAETLGDAARRSRVDDGSNAALELAIDSDDDATVGSDLEDEIDTNGETKDDDAKVVVAKDTGEGPTDFKPSSLVDCGEDMIPQEALIRRRLGRMKELNALYEEQYWRLLEDLRRRHYRFALRHGHGGRKEDATAETFAREKIGATQLSECCVEGCCERPMPLAAHCFAHILNDPKQLLYAPAAEESRGAADPEPVLRTQEDGRSREEKDAGVATIASPKARGEQGGDAGMETR